MPVPGSGAGRSEGKGHPLRILLVNPDYPTNFWSFDSVMELLGKRAHSPPLGLITIAALFPKEWEVRLVDERIRPVSAADRTWSDVILIGGMHVQCQGILKNIREGRRLGKQVVVGGAWVFHTHEEAFEAGADIVVIGEGETAVPALIEAIEQKKTGVILRDHELPDMTTSPVPRFDLLEMDMYLQMSIQTTRGCPFLCEFCDVTLMNGRDARTKSADQVVRELQAYYDAGWRRDIFFVDDTFNANPQRAKPMLREIIAWQEKHQYPFGFVTQCSINLAKVDDLMQLMVKAGFFRVFLGIESTRVETHQLTKKFQNAVCDLEQACLTINKAGLSIIAGCIVGFDNEPKGADERFFQFASNTSIPDMFVTVLQAPPGTDMWKRLEREGREVWKSTDDKQGGSSGLMNFIPTRPIEEIVAEYVNLYRVLYTPEHYIVRLFGHFKNMDPLPFKKPRKVPSLREAYALLRILWRRGVASASRAKFWHYLGRARREFPERFDRFIASLVFYEHLFSFRITVEQNVETQLAERAASMEAYRAARTVQGTMAALTV